MPVLPLQQIGDFLVPHGSTDATQVEHQKIILNNGNIVFSWEERVEVEFPSFQTSARYRVFSSDGVAITGELQANTFSNGSQGSPVMTELADGGFVIIWQSYGQHAEFGHALYGQRFDSDGATVGDEFRVTDEVDMNEYSPTVDGLADGGWVVSWKKIFDRDEADGVDNNEIFQTRFDAAGEVTSGPEPVSETTAGLGRSAPHIQALPDGGWLSVWSQNDMAGATTGGIYQTRFDAAGEQVTGIDLVSVEPASAEPDHISGKRFAPTIALLADGGWIVAWSGVYQDGPVAELDYDSDVYFQRFAADGTRVGEETRANPYEPGGQTNPEVIGLADGGWIVAWTDEAVPLGGGSYSIVDQFLRAQRFSPQGEPLGDAVVIDDPTAELQHSPHFVALADGTLLLSWYALNHLTEASSADIVSAQFAVPSYYTAPEDGPAAGFSLTGENAGQEIVSVDTTGTIGVVTLNPDGSGFSYDPNGLFESLAIRETATDSFVFTVSDGAGGTITVPFTIVVTGANDAPTANDDNLAVFADGTGAVNVTQNDIDPDSGDERWVLYTSVQDTGTLGAVQILSDNDTLSYDPAGAFDSLGVGETAIETFTYIVIDENGGEDEATVTVTITGVNDAPVVGAGAARLDEDTTHISSVAGDVTDPDGDELTFALTAGVASGTLVFAEDGSYTYTPDADFNGADTFSYAVSDGNGGSGNANVILTVDAANDEPIGLPVVTGVIRVGETLAADVTGIVDVDGFGGFSYQWHANDVEIVGATGATLVATAFHYGAEISVDVSWNDDGGTKETVTSETTVPVLGPVISGDDADNTLIGGALSEILFGREGRDVLKGIGGEDVLKGGRGGDMLYGGAGDDEINGGSGKDKLVGGAEDDDLNGGNGNDRLAGGSGDDMLTGGKHEDTFLFKTGWGRDTITDFDAKGNKHDTLDLSSLLTVKHWNDLTKRHLEVDGDDIIIDGRNGDIVVLKNVDLADLDEKDFVF